jgi:hypothetical protein
MEESSARPSANGSSGLFGFLRLVASHGGGDAIL